MAHVHSVIYIYIVLDVLTTQRVYNDSFELVLVGVKYVRSHSGRLFASPTSTLEKIVVLHDHGMRPYHICCHMDISNNAPHSGDGIIV